MSVIMYLDIKSANFRNESKPGNSVSLPQSEDSSPGDVYISLLINVKVGKSATPLQKRTSDSTLCERTLNFMRVYIICCTSR